MRVILKLSGEGLSGCNGAGNQYDDDVIGQLTDEIQYVTAQGVEMGLVVGGGNFWRGSRSCGWMQRSPSDHIGMLATCMNAIYLREFFAEKGIKATVQTPFAINGFTEEFSLAKANGHLADGGVVIFAAGTGHPYFTTDTITALRGAELNCDCILMAKNGVEGVFTDDPCVNPAATLYERITCSDIIHSDLKAFDVTAASILRDASIPAQVFDISKPENIRKILLEKEKIGTYVVAE